jgi:hypothetical protein
LNSLGDIVVTHHLPSERSTPDAYRASATQPWFVLQSADYAQHLYEYSTLSCRGKVPRDFDDVRHL